MFELERTAQRVVLVSTLALFIIFGIRLSFSVFFAEFVQVEQWSNEASATIFSVSMLTFALGSMPGGLLLDRFGPRISFGFGAILLALGLYLSSRADTVEQLIIAYGVVGGFGLAIIGLGPIAANIAFWVPAHARGRAIGIAFAGTGFGSLLFVPLCTWLIAQFGWRNAYLILSLTCLLILLPILIFGLQKAPTEIGRQSSKIQQTKTPIKELFKNPIFWLLMLVSFNALGPLRSLTVHQIAYIESVGVERATASTYVGIAGFLTAGSFIGWGYVSDKIGRTKTFILGAICLIGAVLILVALRSSQSILLLTTYSILLALGEGTRSSQTTALASDTFQNSGLGFINGMVGAMFGFGAAFGPWIVGRLRDDTTSYLPGLTIVVVMIVISIVGFVFISRRSSTSS